MNLYSGKKMFRTLPFFQWFLSLFVICIFILCSCSDKILDQEELFEKDLIGKWNVVKYIDMDGRELSSTYIIFLWYENGLEFVTQNQFYPRYRFGTDSVWTTDYNLGPGSYLILSDSLMLSYQDYSITYAIDTINSDSLILSNLSNQMNPWKGRWFFVKE